MRCRPILLSLIWLQTELDDTESYYQLIIKITISEKRRIAKLWKGKFPLKKNYKGDVNIAASYRQLGAKNTKASAQARNYNFECDRLI